MHRLFGQPPLDGSSGNPEPISDLSKSDACVLMLSLSSRQAKAEYLLGNDRKASSLGICPVILLPCLMGQTPSKKLPTSSSSSNSRTMPPETADSSIADYHLRKHRPGCSGMFWRADPTRATPLANNNDWPRDGAMLRGRAITLDHGAKWLLATAVKQKGDADWKPAPLGAAMPFEHDNHYYLEKAD